MRFYRLSGIILVAVFFTFLLTSNASAVTWEKTFGGRNWDSGHSVQQTADGGYIITGEAEFLGGGLYEVYLIKTDGAGNKIWEKTFGVYSGGSSVQQTKDGGYIIAGHRDAGEGGYSDVYLIKTDGDDDLVANRMIVDPSGLGSTSSTTTTSGGGGGGGGCFIGATAYGFDLGFIILLGGTLAVIAVFRRKFRNKNLGDFTKGAHNSAERKFLRYALEQRMIETQEELFSE